MPHHFYFDESIQDRGGFIVGAYVFGADAEASVSDAIARVGLKPGIDEFKSSARMSAHPEQVKLRAELGTLLRDYRVGVLVAPRADRARLGVFALHGLDQIMQANGLAARPDMEAFFDEGDLLIR